MTKVHRDRIIVGERPKVTSAVLDETNIYYNWKTSLLNKNLKYDLSRCVGCSLCLPCPWDAITLGPIQEVASGRLEGSPLIIIDEDKCTFCGLCDSACLFNAIEARFDDVPADVQYSRLKGKHNLDEDKCAPCVLCAKLCPREAIAVDVKVTPKTQLVAYENIKEAQKVTTGHPTAQGTIAIDEAKCTWCGLCELLCPECITIYWIDDKPKPPNFLPAISIRVDTTQCDYCGLCEVICPSDAVKVKCKSSPPRKIKEPIVKGTMTIDDGRCVDCTLCAIKCPFEALDVTLPLTGKVEIQHLEKCDPTGCVNCFNICPTKAIHATGDKDKIAINEEICVFCGACENACPEQVLLITRDSYQLSQIEKARAWEHARARVFYDHLIGQETTQSDIYERVIKVPPIKHSAALQMKSERWTSNELNRKSAQKRARKLQTLMKQDWRLRLLFERGRVGPLRSAIQEKTHEPTKPIKLVMSKPAKLTASPSTTGKKTSKKHGKKT
ncbi:MAG: 4Fe-4S dicluster domain-containing protein [Candidatus Thorarchaeota archaeon]